MRLLAVLALVLSGCTIQEVTLYKTVNQVQPPPSDVSSVKASGVVTAH